MSPSRARVSALLLVLALAAGAWPTHALTLLDPGDEGEDPLRVRSRGPLRAWALEGNLTLDGTPLGDEPRAIEAKGETWRGFENVTTLHVEGSGRLAIAENGTGLLVPVEAPAADGTEPGANASASPDGDGSDPGGPAEASRPPTTANASTPDGSPQSEAHPDGSGPASPSMQEETDTDEEGSSLVSDPIIPALGLLAAGAFVVELYTRRSRQP